jgi:NAD(P)-dependent dehydrogenase (short-subunit alcohol dehydrogenase family)
VIISFENKVALVTGAAMGMGFATAKAFAEAGAAVVLADFNDDALQTATDQLASAGHRVHAIRCDVSNGAEVEATVDETVSTFGRLDAAFNNAGVQIPAAPTVDVPSSDYERVMGINLRGVWDCMRFELRHMVRQGSGAIVNCSSVGGLVGLPNLSAYHGSKHGVIGMTKSTALEVAAQGIRVNAVCPGTIDTPMVADMLAKMLEAMDEIMKQQPIGRLGRGDEIASAVLWLCSDASSFVVGHALVVDGGFTAR